jgi:hypothetical protein
MRIPKIIDEFQKQNQMSAQFSRAALFHNPAAGRTFFEFAAPLCSWQTSVPLNLHRLDMRSSLHQAILTKEDRMLVGGGNGLLHPMRTENFFCGK